LSRYEFLSPEWQEAARTLRDEYVDRVPEPPIPVRANLVILETPFATKTIDAHIDTGQGHAFPDLGHIASPEMTITMTYETVKSLFIGRDTQAMQMAFMSGQIRVDGDMTRMMFLFDFEPDEESATLAEEIDARLKAITL
jgi:putative sterol carrier protein